MRKLLYVVDDNAAFVECLTVRWRKRFGAVISDKSYEDAVKRIGGIGENGSMPGEEGELILAIIDLQMPKGKERVPTADAGFDLVVMLQNKFKGQQGPRIVVQTWFANPEQLHRTDFQRRAQDLGLEFLNRDDDDLERLDALVDELVKP
jgi:CheY-like chemotaxis protein